MKHVLVLLPLALAACGSPEQAADTPRAQCERQAKDDPRVKQFASDLASDNYYVQYQAAEGQQQALRQATERCMRLRGLAPPGGVEPVRSGGFSLF